MMTTNDKATVLARTLVAAVVAIGISGLSAAGCETQIPDGMLRCDPNIPGACPPGWVCQVRGSDGVPRCYSDEGAFCGNGVRDAFEQCDGQDFGEHGRYPHPGCAAQRQPSFAVCRQDCVVHCTECGNGLLEFVAPFENAYEQCDDGNYRADDGCSSTCEVELGTWQQWVHPLGLRVGHDMVYDSAQERIVLFGGHVPDGIVAETWLYDGTRWWLDSPAASPPPRQNHALVYDAARQRVVLFGGVDRWGVFLDDTWEYDGTQWQEITSAARPSPRRDHALAYDAARGRVVLFGGEDPDTSSQGDTWEYDGSQGSWQPVSPSGPLPSPRRGHKLAYDAAGERVLLFGGNELQTDLWAYDGSQWSTLPASGEAPAPRRHFGLVYDPSEQVLVLYGGRDSETDDRLDDTWHYDLQTELWEETTPAVDPEKRERLSMVYFAPVARSVIFGGISHLEAFGDAWEYDAAARHWWEQALQPPPREGHAMAYDSARGVVIVWGGSRGGVPVPPDTWEFDGTSWTRSMTAHAPQDRVAHALAYDEARGVVVLFGGVDEDTDTAFDETWEYDGTDWLEVTVTRRPPARFMHAMSYDAAQEKVVLFGGAQSELVLYNDTWVFDGQDWTQQAAADAPSKRALHRMVYSPVRQRHLLFGGITLSERYTETWAYDLAQDTWPQLRPSTSPSARMLFGMAYDAAQYRVLLFGGFDGVSVLTDTWAFDGRGWRQQDPLLSPQLSTPVMVFDLQRRRAVMYGGFTDETWEYHFGGAQREQCDNALDDDGDELADCADPDCSLAPSCPAPWLACPGTGGDLCRSAYCGGYPCDELGRVCAGLGSAQPEDEGAEDRYCVCPGLGYESECDNGQDDDCNGLTDCQETEACGDEPPCEYPETTCDDRFDNDGNGLIDCADDGCADFPLCGEEEAELCGDGFDNDGDGEIDCIDGGCFLAEQCPLEPLF